MKELVEYRIWGPPGCGKTYEVKRLAEDIFSRFGPDAALIVSFTKTAAQEIIRRIPDTNRDMVGTLHSICYHALNRPVIAETKLGEFSAEHPAFALTREHTTVDVDDPYAEEPASSDCGAAGLAELNVLRARRVDPLLWPSSIKSFARAWEGWKESHGYLDFTDLVERCLLDVEKAPGDPPFGILDEAQDSSRLQLDLLRKWSQHMHYLMTVGDSDQCLYRFAGASPEEFLDHPVPDERRRILSVSHRVPRAVHVVAMSLREQMGRREEGSYVPRDAEGEVRRLEATFQQPEEIIDTLAPYLNDGKSVMILGACAYMLDPMKRSLRAAGIPFGNTFRPKRGDWNPLLSGNGMSAAERLACFLRTSADVWGEEARVWTRADVYQWSRVLRAEDVFLPRKRMGIEAWKHDKNEATFDDLLQFFTQETADALLFDADVSWYAERLLPTKADSMAYPLAIYHRCGGKSLIEAPNVTIGTVHSVKGGQADVVVLFPDLSRAGMREWMTTGAPKDGILRVFYVAATRARETLLICERATPWAVVL